MIHNVWDKTLNFILAKMSTYTENNTLYAGFILLFLNLSFLARMDGFEHQQTAMATNVIGILINLYIQERCSCKEMMAT